MEKILENHVADSDVTQAAHRSSTATAHTPGPWSVSCVRTRESGEPVLQILGADAKAYALVFYSDKTTAEHIASHADARLIAAAPEMLVVLDACNIVLKSRDQDAREAKVYDAVRAVIAKAIGEQS